MRVLHAKAVQRDEGPSPALRQRSIPGLTPVERSMPSTMTSLFASP